MKIVKLGNYTKIKTGKLDANFSVIDGMYPFFTCSIEPLKIDKYSYDCECVLIAGNGDLNVKYYNGKFDAYQRTYIIESKDKTQLDVKYIYYLLNSKICDLRKNSIGGVIKYIKLGDLTGIEFNLIDIKEQKIIVRQLDGVKKIIDLRKKQIDDLNKLIKSQFVEMFGDIKEKKKLEEFSTLITKGASPKWQGVNYKERGTLFVTSENVKEGYVDLSKTKYLENKINEIQPRSVLKKEDILINIVGASIGRVGKYDYEYLANINQAVALVRTKNINNTFLLTYLNSTEAISMYDDMKKGGARENLSLKNISDLLIPNAPIELQNQFAEIVKQIDKQKFEIQKSLEETEELMESLMNRYFE